MSYIRQRERRRAKMAEAAHRRLTEDCSRQG
jgi:hypothetical protein